MSDEQIPAPTKPKKPKKIQTRIETGIYQNADGTFDVSVGRRVKIDRHLNSKQIFKRSSNIVGIKQARKIRQQLTDELQVESMKLRGEDKKWKVAREEYYKYLDKRLAEDSMANTTVKSTKDTLDKWTVPWDDRWLSEFTTEFFEDFVSSEEIKKLSANTRVNIIKYIRGVFKRQIAMGVIKFNPTAAVVIRGRRGPDYPMYLSIKQINDLIEKTRAIGTGSKNEDDDHWADLYYFAFIPIRFEFS